MRADERQVVEVVALTDWPAIIAYLHDVRRLRYIDIGAEIDCQECWVSRLARGKTRKVDYDVGLALMALYERERAKQERIDHKLAAVAVHGEQQLCKYETA